MLAKFEITVVLAMTLMVKAGKDLTGRLLDVIDQAERFLDLHLRMPHTIHGFEPEPRPEPPKEALREAIVNAVAHRDYTYHPMASAMRRRW